MDVLPIQAVREEDQPQISPELFNLAKLKQWGFPVADGLIILPPIFHLKTILEHYQFKHKEIFEQSLQIIRADIGKIPIPRDLTKVDIKNVDLPDLWKKLLENWLIEIRSNIWREGFAKDINQLSAQAIFFTHKIKSSGNIYYDYQKKKTVLKIARGEIDGRDKKDLFRLAIAANKKLYLPYIYQWIYDGQIKLVKVVPFTQNKGEQQEAEVLKDKLDIGKTKIKRSAIKVFATASEELKSVLDQDIDGLILRGENQHLKLSIDPTKNWLEIKTVEKLVNIENYLINDTDGVILNLDVLAKDLSGNISALTKLLDTPFSLINQANLPVVAMGKVVLHDDLLRFLLEHGVWGIALDEPDLNGVKEHLNFMETIFIQKRAAPTRP